METNHYGIFTVSRRLAPELKRNAAEADPAPADCILAAARDAVNRLVA
jgi:hypothetical protein